MAILDVAGWYAPPGTSIDKAGHVHLTVDFPLGQTVTGTITIPMRVRIHGNRKVRQLRLVLGDGGAQVTVWSKTVDLGPGDHSIPVTVDTRKYRYNGWCHYRFRADTVDGGKAGNVRTIFQVQHSNGFPKREPTGYTGSWPRFTEGQTTMTGTENVQCRLRSAIPTSVKGVWQIELMFDRWGSVSKYPPSGYAPSLVRSLILLDPPDMCAVPPMLGTKLLDFAGKFVTKDKPFAFDSTKYPNGPHTLVLRTEEKPISNGQLGCVYSVPIIIQN